MGRWGLLTNANPGDSIMPRFVVKETKPAWVTWSFAVDANDEDHARDLVEHGEANAIGAEIGDSFADTESQWQFEKQITQ